MSLETELARRLKGREAVVVGVGNPHRGDDAAGCLVARTLLKSETGVLPSRLRVVEAEEIPESFLGPITTPIPSVVVLTDAVNLGAPPGTVALLEIEELTTHEASTHRSPLALVARFIREDTAADVFVLGIQPAHAEAGTAMSPEVERAAVALARLLEASAC